MRVSDRNSDGRMREVEKPSASFRCFLTLLNSSLFLMIRKKREATEREIREEEDEK